MAGESGKCQVCFTPATKCCSACSGAFYCSSEHQAQHWKTHKKDCKAYVLRKNDQVGRHFVATRNLSAGQIILKEIAVTSAPAIPTQKFADEEGFSLNDVKYCVGCHRILLKGTGRECSKCKLPVCSSTCEKFPAHANNECEVLQKISFSRSVMNAIDPDIIFPLRTCLLKKKNPAAWKGVMNLQHGKWSEYDFVLLLVSGILPRIIRASGDFTVNDWKSVCAILATNTSRTTKNFELPDGSDFKACSQFLCLEGSMFAHSCVPNCYFEFILQPNMQLIMRTSTAVKKGEMLTMDYDSNMWSMPTYKRHRELNFVCRCIRCEDPTELGSNLCTFVCQHCKAPEMISTNPFLESADWQCKSCGVVEDGESKIDFMDGLYKTVQDMKPEDFGWKPLKNLVVQYSGKILHPNNWVLVEALINLATFLDTETDCKHMNYRWSNINDNRFYLSSREQLVGIADLVAPGINLQRASVMDNFATTLMRKTITETMNWTVPITLTEFRRKLDSVKENYLEAYKFYKNFVNALEGKKCSTAIQTEEELKNVDFFYKNPPPRIFLGFGGVAIFEHDSGSNSN